MITQHRPHTLVLLFVLVLCAATFRTPLRADDEPSVSPQVDFGRDVMPILAKNCTACHNAKKQEGSLNLAAYDDLMRGGDSGESIVASDADASYLLERIVSESDPMPPEDNQVGAVRLTEQEQMVVRRWIDAGALAPKSNASQIRFQILPDNLQPVYAMASAPDGRSIAVGRGNQALVVDNFTELSRAELLDDPTLESSEDVSRKASHRDLVQSIAFSPDGQRIATGGYKTVKIWQRRTQPEMELSGLPRDASHACFSPDGSRLAMVTEERTIELAQPATGQVHRFLSTHATPVTALAWLHDNQTLLSCDATGQVAITDAVTYDVIQLDTAQPSPALTRFVVASDGGLFGTTSEGKIVEIELSADAAGKWRRFDLRSVVSSGPLSAIVALQDSAKLIVAKTNGAICSIDTSSGEALDLFQVDGPVTSLVLSPNDQLLAALMPAGPPQLWRLSDKTQIAKLDRDYTLMQRLLKQQRDVERSKKQVELLTSRIPTLEAEEKKEVEARTKAEESRAQADEELAARVAEVAKSQEEISKAEKALADAQAEIEAAKKRAEAVAADLEAKKKGLAESEKKKVAAEAVLAKRDQALATASDSAQRAANAIPQLKAIIEAEQKRVDEQAKQLSDLTTRSESLPEATALSFSPDSSRVVLSRNEGTPQVVSTADGQPLASLHASTTVLDVVTYAADSRIIGYARDGRLLDWDARLPWKLERTLGSPTSETFSDRITALDFSPDGRLLAAGGGPPSRFGDAQLFRVDSGELAIDLGQLHSDTILGLRFSPDGRQLATAGADKICRIVDIERGESLRSLEGHTHHVLAVDWRDDGQVLATAGADGDIKLWTPESGQQLRTISGSGKEVSTLRFVGQSSRLLSASIDGKLRLHNADDGKQIREFSGSSGALFALAVLQADAQVAAGGDGGTLQAWQLSDGKLLWSMPQN